MGLNWNKLALAVIMSFAFCGVFGQNAKKYFKTGSDFEETKNYTDAVVQYTKAVELDPEFVDAYIARANAYEQLGEWTKAIDDYNRAITFDTKSESIRYRLGKALYEQGEYEKAVSALTNAIELDKKYLEAYDTKVNALIALKKFQEAMKMAETALEVKKTAQTYFNLGVSLDSLKNYEKAEYNYGRAKYYDSKFEQAYIGLAGARLKQKKFDKAILDCDMVLELNASNTDAYMMKGKIFSKTNEPQKAINELSKVIALDPNNVQVFKERGQYYQQFGQHQSAINDFNKAISLSDEDYQLYYLRATSYEAITDYKSAMKDYEMLRKISPYDENAKKLLEQAQARLYELNRESDAPKITMVVPEESEEGKVEIPTDKVEVELTGQIQDASRIKSILLNKNNIAFNKDTINPDFSFHLNIQSQNNFTVEATDVYDNKTAKVYKVVRTEIAKPKIKLLAPYASDNGEIYLDSDDPSLYIEGIISDESLISSIYVEGKIASYEVKEKNPKFSTNLNIANKNQITIRVTDQYDNVTEQQYKLNREAAALSADNPMGKTWVIFIENSNYKNFASLEGPTKDVTLMKASFAKYKIHNIIHKKDMSKEEFERFFSIELRDLVRSNRVNSLLVWYAGHGKFINETGYWVPIDARRDDEFTYFNINTLKASLQSYSKYVTHTLIITDACESGPSFYQAMRSTAKSRDCNDWTSTRFKSSQVFSSAGYELAVDNSQFTRTFSQSLNSNPNACIPIEKIVSNVTNAVVRNNQQKPKFGKISGLEDEDGTFFFMKK